MKKKPEPSLSRINGLSLVEILIATTLITMLGLGVINVLLIGQRTFFSGLGTLELKSEVNNAYAKMHKEMREADSYSITVIDSDSHRITFSTPNESGISYYHDTGDANGDGILTQIIREYPSGTRTIVASNVKSLTFSVSGGVIESTITTAQVSGGNSLEFTSKSKLEARND